MKNVMSRNKCIDTVKGIACVLVLFIHYPFPGVIGQLIKAIGRSSVPFFFMVSGYFYDKHRDNGCWEFGEKAIFSNGILLICGFVVSELFLFVQSGSIYSILKRQVAFDNILKLIIFNNTGSIYHLWFLIALIYCYIIWMVIDLKHKKIETRTVKRMVIIVIVICYVIEILSAKAEFYQTYLYRNWLFIGMPFFSLGVIYEEEKYDERTNVLLMLFCIILTIVEFFIIGNVELYVGSVLLAVEVFAYCQKHPFERISVFCNIGAKYSAWFYILHYGLIFIECFIMKRFHLDTLGNGIYTYISPIVVAVYTLLTAVFAQRVYSRVIGKVVD